MHFTDRIELAFYWILLDPYRTKNCEPRGVVILRDLDGNEQREEVELEQFHLDRVRRLIRDVRTARRIGVEPELCLCPVCAGRPEIAQACRKRGSPSLLYGIAGPRVRALKKLGIHNLDDITICDPEATRLALREHKHFVNLTMIHGWKAHIRAYETNKPVLIGEACLDFTDYIAVDFEYLSGARGFIWLIGYSIVSHGVTTSAQLWADDSDEVRRNLLLMAEVINRHPKIPVVTWSGLSAELPELQKAADFYEINADLQPFVERHFDLFAFAETNIPTSHSTT